MKTGTVVVIKVVIELVLLGADAVVTVIKKFRNLKRKKNV